MYGYRVEFTFSNGETSYIGVYTPKKMENPTPFDLLDFKAVKVDWSNVVIVQVHCLSREIN